ncbi:MAG: DUF1343 domain-containing protein [Desulfobacteraceae bacterium]
MKVLTGLDVLKEEYWQQLKGYRLGLLSNQASLDSQLKPAKEIFSQLLPGQLKSLYGPQHGHGGEDQDNMVETDHSFDRKLDVPIFSLYSKLREPSSEMLDLIEVLVIDLQDVGTRVYTFASTMLGCLRAAAKSDKKVVILDRPNPLGGEIIEGNLLEPELYSFVGPYRLPMRHSLTMGEMAQIFNHVFDINADLDVVAMKGWERPMIWQETGLRWIPPSPNMPLPQTAQVYPGQVIWEGTNLSEGRGTCRPFEIFGAPFLDIEAVRKKLIPEATKGCTLQEISFRPTFHKWHGEICRGFMIHITNHSTYQPYFTAMAFLSTLLQVHKQQIAWKSPPYEYEFEKMPIDMILGDLSLRTQIEEGVNLSLIREEWLEATKHFLEWRSPYLLYR